MLLTISEFSKKYKISKQYIIDKLESDYKPYLVIRGKRVYIDEEKYNSAENQEQQLTIPIDTESKKKEERPIPAENEELVRAREEIAQLKAELEKERQKNNDTQEKLMEMMDKTLKLTENTQILMGRLQEQERLLIASTTERKKSIFKRIKEHFTKKEESAN